MKWRWSKFDLNHGLHQDIHTLHHQQDIGTMVYYVQIRHTHTNYIPLLNTPPRVYLHNHSLILGSSFSHLCFNHFQILNQSFSMLIHFSTVIRTVHWGWQNCYRNNSQVQHFFRVIWFPILLKLSLGRNHMSSILVYHALTSIKPHNLLKIM